MPQLIARVAVSVRLYFDIRVPSDDEADIRRAAHEELQRVESDECIRVMLLSHPNVYPIDDWPALSPREFNICEVAPAHEVTPDTRFPL